MQPNQRRPNMENQKTSNDTKAQENMMQGNMIFMCTSINEETTNKMTAKLIEWVNKLKPAKAEVLAKNTATIISPYDEWPEDQPVLEVYLQTPGGTVSIAKSIMSLFKMARAKGAIIKTINLSAAASCGSLLAVSGTKGYRYMAEDAYNLIHYGSRGGASTRDGEAERMLQTNNEITNSLKKIYLDNTQLSLKEINKYFTFEDTGRLNAKACLEKGICDFVITSNGQYINDPKLIQSIKTLKYLSR